MRKFLILNLLLLFSFYFLPANSEERYTLKAQVAVVQELPPDMYGSWHRSRSLITSTFPNSFVPFETGYWVIEKNGEQITLTNPEKDTRATIQVQAVDGNTARFEYHSALANGTPCREELTLTASQTALFGLQKKECFPQDAAPYSAMAKVEAIRLEGNVSWFQ